jgi:murein DD-endopeptidase MepM/ murein hydrolase activator NlpD
MNAARTQATRLTPAASRPRLWHGNRRMRLCCLVVIALALSDAACAASPRPAAQQKPKGVTHVVQQGESLFRISQAYGVPVAVLADANRIKPSAPLKVGQRLFVPGATAVRTVETSRRLTTDERAALERTLREELTLPASPPSPAPPPTPRVKTDADFIWPIHGPLNSPFGPRNGRLHAGIDIGSPHYQEVVAAADAEVIYANDTRGPLGKAVVLQHAGGMRTVYAHLSIIIARERDTVRQGQAIGGVGDTGRATGPHLHFEIRQDGVPRNPEEYLPATIDDLMRELSAPTPTERNAKPTTDIR